MSPRGWRLPFKLFGVPVELDPSFALVLPLFAWLIGSQVPAYAELMSRMGVILDASRLTDGAAPWLLGLAAAIGLFLSVLIHELGHALTARAYGVRTLRITLWFLGGVAQLEEMPRRRGAEAVVAIAGPVTSVGLGLLLATLLRSGALGGGAAFVVSYLTLTNLALAVFNLLPALPLDGGRVLRSLLSLRMDEGRATRVVGNVGRTVAVLLGIYGFLTLQIYLLAIAFFIYTAGNAEVLGTLVRRSLEGHRVREAMTASPVTIDLGWPLAQLKRLQAMRPVSCFPVLDVDGRPLGLVRSQDLAAATDEATVGELLKPAETVGDQEELEAAVKRLAESQVGRLLVVDAEGRLVGLLSKTDVVRWLEKAAHPKAGPGQDGGPGSRPEASPVNQGDRG